MHAALLMAIALVLSTCIQSCTPSVQTESNQAVSLPTEAVVAIPALQLSDRMNSHQALAVPRMLAHSQKYSRASIEQMCKRQPTIAWCPEGIRQTDTSMLPIKEIREIGTSAYSHFIYAREKEDLWFDRSYEADLGIKWYGDCDDITTTTLSRLHAAGQPLDKMWMLLVDIDRKELIDHIVGVVQDDLGQFWVVGDTSKRRHTYPLHSMKYRPMIIARMDNPTNWQAVTQSTVMQGFPLVLAR